MIRRLLVTSALAGVAIATATPVLANPTGGSVSAGQATISSSGQTVTIQQSSSKAVLNWASFNIAPGELTQFLQPSSSAIALNRISDVNPSSIEGSLTANGNVILVNPNGVVFGKNSQVNVAGLVATTANISDNDFMNNAAPVFNQPGNPNAQVINQGTITAAQAGLVGLVAPNVENSGTITAKLGKVQMASGDTFTLDLAGDGITQVGVSNAVLHQLVSNGGAVVADGGTVQLTAAAARSALDSLIVNTGVIRANSIRQQGGTIILSAATPGSVITNSGTITAQGGGRHLRGGHVPRSPGVGGSVRLAAGTINQNGTINVSGESGGNVSMRGSVITQSGTIFANGRSGPGGTITIRARDFYTDYANSLLTTTSAGGTGGSITIAGGDNAIVTASGTYVSDGGTTGGSIEIFSGNEVMLLGAYLSSRGPLGGGTVRVGGDYVGTTGRRRANDTEIDDNTLILADDTDNGSGGQITISGTNILFAGQASAQGGPNGGAGGNITLFAPQSNGESVALLSGTLEAAGGGAGATGGNVSVLGDNVGLLSGALIDASGEAGGGYAKIGGDFHGQGTTPTAQNTYVDANATILANATNEGNGGNVAVWSDNYTNFAGTIEAKGGNGGNGGYVETSGHDLSVSGMVYAAQWLLDPNNVTIAIGSDTATPAYTAIWTATGSGNLQPSDITGSLNAGTSVNITASGTIAVNSAIAAANNSNVTLTLSAGSTLTLSAPISTSGSGTLGVNLTGSTIALNYAGTVIASNGGTVTLNNAVTVGANTTINSGGGGITFGSTIDGANTLTLANGVGTISVGGIIGGGTPLTDLIFQGSGGFTLAHAATVNAIDFSSYTGTLTMNSGLTVAGNVTLGAGMTVAGASGLTVTTTSTLTSNGATWTNGLTLQGTVTDTFADNWTVGGTLTLGQQNTLQTLNGHTIFAGSNLAFGVGNAGTVTGTTSIVLNGTGTWSDPGADLKNNLTINTAGTITVSGTVYYDTGTFTYTSGTVTTTGSTLVVGATTTLPSGITWNNLTLSGAGGSVYTLSSDVTVNGNLTLGTQNATQTINGHNLLVGGNLTLIGTSGSGIVNGTTNIVLDGTGTWSNPNGVDSLQNNLNINTAGTITVSGNIYYNTGTLTYTAGTVNTTGSTLNLTGSTTLNTNGMSWNNLTLNSPGATYTLASDTTVNGNLSYGGGSSNGPAITMNGNTMYVGGNLTILSGGNGNFDNGTTNIVLDGTGTWSQQGGGALVFLTNNLTINTAGTITISGAVLYNTGALVYTAGTVVTTGSTMNFGAIANNLPAGITWNNLSLSGTFTLPTNLAVDGILTLSNSTPSSADVYTLSSDINVGALTLTVGNNATISINGHNIYDSGNLTSSTSAGGVGSFAGTTNIILDGTGTWTTTAGTHVLKNNLTIDTPGTITVSGNVYYNTGTLSVTGGTLNLNGNNFQPGGGATFIIGSGGNLELWGSETITTPTLNAGSTVTFTGNGNASANTYTLTNYFGGSYQNLTINSTDGATDTFQLGSALTVAGNLTNTAGTLDASASNYAINVGGNWSNSGTFVPRSGTVTINGTSPTISGTDNFYNLIVESTGSLTLPSITANTILAEANGATSDLIIAPSASLTASGTGSAITLVAGRNFINNSGSNSPLVDGSGQWLVYSTSAASDTNGASVMNPTTTTYNTTYPSGTPTGNTWFYSTGNPATNEGSVTITATGWSESYGNAIPTLTYSCSGNATVCGSVGTYLTGALGVSNESSTTEAATTLLTHANGFDVTGSTGTTSGSGIYTIIQNALTWASGYTGTINYTSANVTLAAKSLGSTGFAVAGKTYDGTVAATITSNGALTGGGSISGDGKYVTGDTVSITAGGTATFGSKNAGTETATGSLTLTGAQAGDYALLAPTATATISQATLTITANAESATYGDTLGALTYTDSGLQTGDSITGALTVTGVGNAGTVLTNANGVNVSGSPFAIARGSIGISDGNSGHNYNTIVYNGANLTLSAKTLTDSGFAVAGKTYDGTTTATISSNGSLTGGGSTSGDGEYITGDTVSIASGGSATFGSKNAGSETATGSLTLTGAQAGDYTLTAPTATATISKATLTITANAESATYGDTLGTLTYTNSGLQTGDSITGTLTVAGVGGAGTVLTNANGVNVSGSPFAIAKGSIGISDGNSGNNYNTIVYNSANLTLAAKTLTDSGFAVSGKTYDGTTAATITSNGSLSGVIGGDTVTLNSGSASASFDNPNVGTTHTVTASSYALAGAQAGDYTLTQPTASNITISAAAITITATGQSQTYGFGGSSAALGTTGFNESGSLASGQSVTGVTLSTNASSSSSNNYDAGTWNITPSAATGAGGFTAGNYSITYVTDTGGLVIAAKTLTDSGFAVSGKTYDGTTTASISSNGSLSGVIGGDTVTLNTGSAVATFDNQNVGTTHTVTAGGYGLTGAQAGDYTLAQPSASNVTISQKALTVTADAESATYGDTLGTLTYGTSGLVSGDSLTGALTVTGVGNAGTVLDNANGVNVSGSPFAITQGTLANSNYAITYNAANLTLSAKTLTDSGFAVPGKTYDGTTAATITGNGSLTGGGSTSGDGKYITGDTVSLNSGSASAAFDNASVGTTHTVTASGYSLSGAQAGDYTLSQPTASNITISAAAVTVTANPETATYGDTLGTLTYSTSGLASGDTLTGALTVTGVGGAGTVLDNANGVNVSGSPFAIAQGTLSNGNYAITFNGANLTLLPKALINSGFAVSGKTYDGATTATITSNGSLTGGGSTSGDGKYITGDTVSINSGSASATFGSTNAGTETATGSGYTLSGAQAGDYALTAPTATATISQKALTVTADSQTNTYGDAIPTLTYSTSGLVSGDTLTGALGVTNGASGTATAGTVLDHANSFDVSGSPFAIVQNTLANGNYSITYNGASLTLAAKTLTDSGFAVSGKIFDGTTAATITSNGSLSGVVGGDTVNLNSGSAVATFDNPNVGTTHTVTASGYTLTGAQAGNYTLTQPTATNIIISAANTITLTALDQTVTYGTAPNASVVLGTTYSFFCSNGCSSSVLTTVPTLTISGGSGISTSGNYAAGSWNITPSAAVDSNGYLIDYVAGTLTVNPKAVTISGFAANNKTYDGATAATIASNGSLSGLISGDSVSLNSGSASAAFDNASVGTTHTVTASGYALSSGNGNNDANDYTLTQPTAGNVTISAKALTDTTFTVANKTYDGTTGATITADGSLVGVVGGDMVTLNDSGASAAFDNKNAGTTHTVTASGYTLSGAQAGDYTLTQPIETNVTINPATLTVIANAESATYGDTLGTLTYTTSGLVSGDTLTGTLTTAHGGTGTVLDHANGFDVSGSPFAITQGTLANSNYAISYTGANLTLAAKALTDSGFAASGKTYDGTTTATITSNGSLSGVIGGDTVTLNSGSASASFDNPNVGTTHTVTASSYALAGAQAGDYTLTQPTASNITISAAAITITATGQSQTYGFGGGSSSLGTTGFNESGSLASGQSVTGVTLSTNASSSSSNNYDAGTWNITPSAATGAGGFTASNYTITYTTDTGGLTIAAKTLTDSGFAVSGKTYDGTTTASISSNGSLSGVIGGDSVSLNSGSASATFDNKNVGTTHTVTAGGYGLSGAQAGDYTLLAQPTASNVTISAANLIVTANAESATYGDTLGTLTYSTSGLVSGDSLTGALTVTGIGNAGTVLDNANGINVSGSPFAIAKGTLANGNYSITYNSANLTLLPKALTDSGFAVSGKTYDGTTTATITGNGSLTGGGSTSGDGKYITGDTVSINSGSAIAAFGSANAGSETATGSGYTLAGPQAADYTLTAPAATATISQKALTVTANPETANYGDSLGAFSYSTSGLVSGDTLTGTLGVTNEASGTATVGTVFDHANNFDVSGSPFAITQGTLGNSNYNITYNGASLTLGKGTLNVTANNLQATHGSPVPPLTYSVSGFAGGETLASAGVTGSPGLSTAATNLSPVGNYVIDAVQGSLAAANYGFHMVDGSFAINPPPPASLNVPPSVELQISYAGMLLQMPGAYAEYFPAAAYSPGVADADSLSPPDMFMPPPDSDDRKDWHTY